MPTSLCQIAVHIIFSTKNRTQCLTDSIHSYIHGIITNYHGIPIRINGTEDHIHILCYIPKDLSIVEFIRIIKTNSSKWFKTKNAGMYWQTGYAAYGVSQTNINIVAKYIRNQKEHHSKVSFQEEMKKYLILTGAEGVYNEWFLSNINSGNAD